MTPLDLALDGLAAARITRLVTEDRIADRPRAALSAMHPQLDYLLGCPWCVGMYVGAGVALAGRTRVWRTARLPLAVAAIAGFVAASA